MTGDISHDLNKLGQAGLWSRMPEQLEKMPYLRDREKEAGARAVRARSQR